MSGEPDVVVQVVDATNLERNLYLALQVIETGLPVVVALNMADLAAPFRPARWSFAAAGSG